MNKKDKILLLFCEFTELYHIPYRILNMTKKHLWTWIQKPRQTLQMRSWKLLAEKYFKAKWLKTGPISLVAYDSFPLS